MRRAAAARAPWLLLLVAAACGAPLEPSAARAADAVDSSDATHAERAAAGLADHHVHLLGPGLIRDWKAIGATFSKPDAAYLSADELLRDPDGDGPATPPLAQALLVPMAHFYGNEELRGGLALSAAEEATRAAAENDHVAAEAARWPGRAAVLASVDLLRPWALAELKRVRARHPIVGVKLHLGSAGFDFRDEHHLAALAALVDWTAGERLLLLLHLDPQRRGTTVADVTALLERVFAPHPDLEVVIAHLGGSGGFGPWPRSVVATCGAWLAGRAQLGEPRRGFRFDLSAVPMTKPSEGMAASSEEEIAALAPALREVGLERFLFGSDWPVFDPRDHAQYLRERCGFEPAEIEQLLAQRCSAFDRSR